MNAKNVQKNLKEGLSRYFGEAVTTEWPIYKSATDIFSHDSKRYSPRVDVAVQTTGITSGNHFVKISNFWNQHAPKSLKNLFRGYDKNMNPRCALAIEVVHSGSSKHILGDITNASMMGVYGIVAPSAEMLTKVTRVFEYVRTIREAGKAPETLFKNVVIISEKKLLELLR